MAQINLPPEREAWRPHLEAAFNDAQLMLAKAAETGDAALKAQGQRILARLQTATTKLGGTVGAPPRSSAIFRQTRTTPQAMLTGLGGAPGLPASAPNMTAGPAGLNAEIQSMGPITPVQATASGATAGKPTVPPEDTGPLESPLAGVAQITPDEDKKFQLSAEDSPELAAFKAALEAPEPVFRKMGFTSAERVALGFLAGLKGIESVTPIIEQRRSEGWQAYQTAVQARAARLQNLASVANIARVERAEKVEQQRLKESIAREDRHINEQRDFQMKLAGFREAGLDKRAKMMASFKFPPGFAQARKERRDLDNLRSEVRKAQRIVRDYPNSVGPTDQFTWAHLSPSAREAARQVQASLSTISSLMASTESGGKNLTETELELFGGRFPQASEFAATVGARLSNADAWLTRKIGSIDQDFPSEDNLPGPKLPQLPEGLEMNDTFELGY